MFEHCCCLSLSRLKDEFFGNVIAAVDDADCPTDLPGPEDELAYDGSDFLDLGTQQDIPNISGPVQQEPFTGCIKLRRPVLGPDEPSPNFPAPADACLIGFHPQNLLSPRYLTPIYNTLFDFFGNLDRQVFNQLQIGLHTDYLAF